MYFREKLALIISAFVISLFYGHQTWAMPVGTLLFRTSGGGNLYGYNTENLITVKNKIISGLYTGHVAIYVGAENGVDYIVEAMPDGLIKVPAKYFLNSYNDERLIGAKIPKNLSETQRIKVAELAKTLAANNLSYDFDFNTQKGPASGDWTCVGLTEKIYENANISNPLDLSNLEYNPDYYAIDITPDGFDNFSILNKKTGDCLSKNLEFSKISAWKKTLIPLPEIWGFNAGVEHNNERYFFFPLTQYYQNSLKDVEVDIELSSGFSDSEIRGDTPEVALIFKWTFINYPISAIKRVINNIFDKNSTEKESVDADNLSEDNSSSSKSSDNLLSDNTLATGSIENITEATPVSSVNKIILGKIKSSITVDDKNISIFDSENNNNNNDDNDDEEDENDVSLDNEESEEEENNNIDENNNDNKDEDEDEDEDKDEDEDENTNDYYSDLANQIVISRIYSTLNNDYIELYNPTNINIDLEEFSFRLSKTKTSATPSFIMRIGNIDDGSYPGGTIIKAKSKYLIVRSSAESDLKTQAQAIANRSNFTFTGNGYTIYLSRETVSSDSDEDIIDKVGYGEALYFEKYPAPEILDNYLLVRKAKSNSTAITMAETGSHFSLGNAYDSNNNKSDFVLVSLIEEEDNNENSNNEENNNTTNNTNNTSTINTSTNENNSTSTNNYTDDTENNTSGDELEETSASDNSANDNLISSLLLSRIYATLTDDYIELYNPNSSSIDLSTAGIRLYKTKTSATPSLMMRLGNLADGSYPGGLIVNPYGKYMIARASSSLEIKAKAQAISTRNNFSLTGDAYTVYLSDDPVSSDNDIDIIDKVGYGQALYYYMSPASEILDNYVLTRKALSTSTASDMSIYGNHFSLGNSFNSKNNGFDFVLVGDNNTTTENLINTSTVENKNTDEENNTTTNNTEIEENSTTTESENTNSENNGEEENESNDTEIVYADDLVSGYCIDPGLYLDNIIHSWHFDECEGTTTYDFINNQASEINSIWQAGKFGCGLKQYFNQNHMIAKLDSSFDSNNFTISYYYQNIMDNSRPEIVFSNSVSGESFTVKLYPTYSDLRNIVGMIPSIRFREVVWPQDQTWHLFTWVVNKNLNYWAFYRDGVEVYRKSMESGFFTTADTFKVKGDNGYNLMDEITIFNRALNGEEVAQIYNFNLPLNSVNCYPVSIRKAELTNYWNFDEYAGNLAYDIFGLSHLNLSSSSRAINETGNNNINITAGDEGVSAQFLYPFYYKNMSLSFWWKNNFIQSTSEFFIKLMSADQNIFGFNLSRDNFYYYFNNLNFKVNTDNSFPVIENDNLWHQAVLAYDSYHLQLNLYIDGLLYGSWNRNWLNSTLIDRLVISSQGEDFVMDELGLWNGTLNSAEIEYLYNNQKSFFVD